jgi:heptosyltransferase-3
MTKAPPDFKRILIVATRQIGDVLCTTPLMRRARELWPDATIDVLGYEKTMGMLVGNSDINEVIESSEHPRWPEYKKLTRRIFRRYDLAIVTQSSDRAHIYGLLAAPNRVGIVPETFAHRWWKQWASLYTVTSDGSERHVVADRLTLMSSFGGVHLSASVRPPTPVDLPSDLRRRLERYVVVHATPMWHYKRWPIASWARLIELLIRDGLQVVLTGSGSENDRSLNTQIRQAVDVDLKDQVLDTSGLLDLGQVSSLISGANAYVGVDTSVTHQAAAIGIPVVALYGPTTPVNFGPWPQGFDWKPGCQSAWQRVGLQDQQATRLQKVRNVTLLQGPGSCVPCMKAGCQNNIHSHSDCLDRLTVDSVYRTLHASITMNWSSNQDDEKKAL